jgi:hypothetical protein
MPAPAAGLWLTLTGIQECYKEAVMTIGKGLISCIGMLMAVPVLIFWPATPAQASWLPEVRLTTAAEASYLSGNNAHCLVPDPSGGVHLVWYDYRGGDSEIYYKHFNGVSWGPDVQITSNGTDSEDPAAAVDLSGILHVVWVDYPGGSPVIYYKSFDGASWSATDAVTHDARACENPSIAADGMGNLHLVWRDYVEGNWGIFYSTFDGMAWSEPIRITDPTGYPRQAAIACDDSQHVHVVWDDYRNLNWEVYYTCLEGGTWGGEVRLTYDGALSKKPTVVADTHGSIHVFWDDNRAGSFDIYQKTFDGISWSADTRIVEALAEALAPSVAAGLDGALHLVWYDSPATYSEIFYAVFDGMAWGPVERLSQAALPSENPMIALDANGIPNVVWQDQRDGNFEIYWRIWSTLAKPEITSIQPDSAFEYSVLSITDLAGANFFDQVEVWLRMAGQEDIQATNETVVSSTKVTCDLDLWEAAVGYWDVVIENPDLQRDTLVAGFGVIPLPPLEVSSIQPDHAAAYQDVHITDLSGQGFLAGATVRLEMAGEDIIEATNVNVESPTQITCDFNLTGAKPGTWDVYIHNSDGHNGTIPEGFTIFASPWNDDFRLTHDGAESSLSLPNGRSIAVDSHGHLHVVWSDRRDANREIYYKYFNGTAWSGDVRLTDAPDGSVNPAIAIDGNDDLHVVWDDYRNNDYEIYYKRRTGAVWGADTRLTTAAGESRYPSIAVDGDTKVYVVWEDKPDESRIRNIHFRMYDGTTWMPEQIIASDVAGSRAPAIAIDGNNHAHVAWYQDYVYGHGLYYARFDGSMWSEPDTLAQYEHIYSPTIATDNFNRVHIAWHDERPGNYEIFYRRFDGLTWDPEERVTFAPGTSANSSIAVDDSGYVYLGWVDDRDGNDEIYYTHKRGMFWTAPTRLTKDPAESTYPSLAVAPDGTLNLVWRDLRDGNYEIYYKMRESGALAGMDNPGMVPVALSGLRVVPNPTQASAEIRFRLGSDAEPVLSVYDVTGRLVERIEPGLMGPGPQGIAWDGTDRSARSVAAGIYLLEVATPEGTASTKIIVLR